MSDMVSFIGVARDLVARLEKAETTHEDFTDNDLERIVLDVAWMFRALREIVAYRLQHAVPYETIENYFDDTVADRIGHKFETLTQ